MLRVSLIASSKLAHGQTDCWPTLQTIFEPSAASPRQDEFSLNMHVTLKLPLKR